MVEGDLLFGLDVVARHHVGEAEEGRGAVGEVADDEPVGLASVLVDEDEVRHLVLAAGVDELLGGVVAAVDALGVGEDEAHLLDELDEAGAGVAGRGAHHAGVGLAGALVFVVDGVPGDLCFGVLQLDLVAQLSLLLAQLGGDWSPRVDGLPQFLFLLEKNMLVGLKLQGRITSDQ